MLQAPELGDVALPYSGEVSGVSGEEVVRGATSLALASSQQELLQEVELEEGGRGGWGSRGGLQGIFKGGNGGYICN